MSDIHELMTADGQRGVAAVLGPTNTGKTHLALERMLRHRAGMIGLPLRLLAREVYDKLVDRVGPTRVALVTGEEKIVPAGARYFACTVEAMPLDRRVPFLAVDEVQLAAHRTRGHVFTDRLLHARGILETLFLGSATAAPLVEQLVPGVEITSQPRLSRLSHAGHHKLRGLPPRTAVVAFSASQVYAIAERLRARHGGAAVVMGALSPRTRNAQVSLYQSGEVPYLVATDAIGLGLNMDVDHVAFAATRKFDGRSHRALHDDELAQIAGRAGRFLADGSFGTTADADPFVRETIDAIEHHRFPPLKKAWWRNPELDFSSAAALVDSLERPPPRPMLRRMPDADDHTALVALVADPEVVARLGGADDLRLLWEVAQVPDYRKTLTGHHAQLLARVFGFLQDRGVIPDDEVEARLARLERTEGDIDALMARIAHVRTWTYLSHRPSWLRDARAVQERTRAIEDRLSDALHERLAARFVDHRVLGAGSDLAPPEIRVVEDTLRMGERVVGRVEGLHLRADPGADALVRRALEAAAIPLVRARALALGDAPDADLTLDPDGRLRWLGAPVGSWARGVSPDQPRVRLHEEPLLDAGLRSVVAERMQRFTASRLSTILGPLRRKARKELSHAGEAVAVALEQALGTVRVRDLWRELQRLSPSDRKVLARLDVRLGQHVVYLASTLKPASRRVRAIAWRAWKEGGGELPPDGATSATPRAPDDLLLAVGFPVVGNLAVRADTLERCAALARKAGRRGPFALPPEIPSWLGADESGAASVLAGLGYGVVTVAGELRFVPSRR